MNLCDINKALNVTIGDFIKNVNGVNEESITDYLMWQWRKIDPSMQYYRTEASSKHEEHYITGADLKIEIWSVTRLGGKALSLQAKKCLPQYGSYRKAFRYGDPAKQQIDLLITHAIHATPPLNPCYLIYTLPDSGEKTKDGNEHIQDYGAFIANAYEIEKFADLNPRSHVSRADILKVSYPLHYIFCGIPSSKGTLNQTLFSETYERAQLPSYVQAVLNEAEPQQVKRLMEENGFKATDRLVVQFVED